MIELMNIINSVADSNLAYYMLIVILAIVVVAMIYLIISQNKEMAELAKSRRKADEEEEEFDDYIEEMAKEVKEEKQHKKKNEELEIEKPPFEDDSLGELDEKINDLVYDQHKKDTTQDIEVPVDEETQEVEIEQFREEEKMIDEDQASEDIPIEENVIEEKDNYDKEYIDNFEAKPMDVAEELINESNDRNEERKKIEKSVYATYGNRVANVEKIELPREKKMELIDATLTNLPNLSLLDETLTAIPPIMEYSSSDVDDLMSITREIEMAPKEKTIKLTPYEEEQEEKAIISYDELMDQKDKIVYEEEKQENDVNIKKVDLEQTIQLNLDEINNHEVKQKEEAKVIEDNKEGYEYEEGFLSQLKNLQNKLY